MQRQQDVLRRGAGGQDLLDGRYLGARHDAAGDDDDERRAQRLVALALQVAFAQARNAAQRGGRQHLAELPALVALDEHEAPGAQPAVIGRAHRGLQHGGEVFLRGGGVAVGLGGAARDSALRWLPWNAPSDERMVDVLHVVILLERVDELEHFGGLRFG